MADVVFIARCPVHGLHGERTTCFAYEQEGMRDCDGTVEQVAMVERDDVIGPGGHELLERFGDDALTRAGELLQWAESYGEPEEWAKRAQATHSRAERYLAALFDARDDIERLYVAAFDSSRREAAEAALDRIRVVLPKAGGA